MRVLYSVATVHVGIYVYTALDMFADISGKIALCYLYVKATTCSNSKKYRAEHLKTGNNLLLMGVT